MSNRERKDAGICLDKVVMDALDARAEVLGFSRSAMINYVLRQYLGLIPDDIGFGFGLRKPANDLSEGSNEG